MQKLLDGANIAPSFAPVKHGSLNTVNSAVPQYTIMRTSTATHSRKGDFVSDIHCYKDVYNDTAGQVSMAIAFLGFSFHHLNVSPRDKKSHQRANSLILK
ncbi:hypothetical protein PoB_006397500 [Plakobranchus ocellatus]|uniref:Uncharacterized protein n=1 Tax=Plakobranchus ocellatus TaxID=259542 RepID=A0AAV4D0A0_9GAST|nr:hypothetical protein PoB_006397500 [Plakobranchus ocellatus]